ncbi:MAG: methionine synthase, partial [Nocardioides sp.]
MTLATGVGSLPGTDIAEAVRLVVGELPDLPHLPELPERGAAATMTGRALAMVDLASDLQPAGWRLTGPGRGTGIDQRRARSLLGQDLDQLEEQLDGYVGHLKVQVAGPWTLAATVERPRGDKVLADHGARRDLAQALAEGVRTHIADVRRRVTGAGPIVLQVDEPALAAVMNA